MRNVWYFFGGGIGGFLSVLNAVNSAYAAIPPEKRGTCYVVLTAPPAVYRELARLYPHVRIIHFKPRNIRELVFRFFKEAGRVNYIYMAPSFGNLHLLMHLYARLLALRHKSRVIGFVKKTWMNRLLHTDLFERPLYKSIFYFVPEAMAEVLPMKIQAPDLMYEVDADFAGRLSKTYIVVHPFPANPKRTLPRVRWVALLSHLYTHYPDVPVVISGAEGDRASYDALCAETKQHFPFLFDMADGDLMKEIQTIANAAVFVGVDTGITHVACVLGVRSVVIGNNSNPMWLPTYNPNATILVNSARCTCTGDKGGGCFVVFEGKEYYRCMFDIPQEEMYVAIDRALASSRTRQ